MTAIAPSTAPSSLLRIGDLTAVQLNELLDLAHEMKDGPAWWNGTSDGAVACLFDEASARARVTFEVAVERLGMRAVAIGPDAPTRELGSMAAIVVSSAAPGVLDGIARAATVPVVDARTCQPLADLLALRRRFGYLEGLRLAYVGAASHHAHSLLEAGALAGMHVAIATPRGYEPDHDVVKGALRLADRHGGSIQVGHDPHAAVALADAVYTDAWASEGPYRVDAALMRAAAGAAVFMHAQPGRRGLEVTDEVFDGAASIVREQAADRVPCAQATLHTVAGPGSRRLETTTERL